MKRRENTGKTEEKKIKWEREKGCRFLAGDRLVRAGGGFFLAAALLQAAARLTDGFGQWYAVTIYPFFTGTLGRFSALFPFSLAEAGLYALLIAAVWCAIRWRKRPARLLRAAWFAAALFCFLYTACCGVNYYRRPFSSYLDWEAGTYGKEDLEELLAWLTGQVNASYTETGTRGAGETGRASVEAMHRLAETYPWMAGYYPRPKPVACSALLSVQQLCGVYSPFTVEANYNAQMTAYNIPHTICHELSHLRGFMREDEANLIGFLACVGSEDAEYRYSGYLMGWIYAGNALAAADWETYSRLRAALRPEADADLRENTAFWACFDSPVSEAAEAVNDTYLKANSQEEGILTYDRAVNLMLAWFFSEDGPRPRADAERLQSDG